VLVLPGFRDLRNVLDIRAQRTVIAKSEDRTLPVDEIVVSRSVAIGANAAPFPKPTGNDISGAPSARRLADSRGPPAREGRERLATVLANGGAEHDPETRVTHQPTTLKMPMSLDCSTSSLEGVDTNPHTDGAVREPLTSGITFVETLDQAMDRLDERLGARRAALLVADPSTGTVRVEAVHGMAPTALRPRRGLGVAGRVAETGLPIVVPAIRHEPMALAELTDPASWHDEALGMVSVPVSVEGRCVGALSVYFALDRKTGFDARLQATRTLASTVAEGLRGRSRGNNAGHSRSEPTERGVFEYSNMIGASPAMRQVYEEVGQVARTTATALILGESGTGKELVAHAIHANSERSGAPFIKINSAAFPETLFESELFGHERGAFTGAVGRKKGRLDRAQGGTLFLDEIGDLPLSTQVKLLRVLQSREYERLGGTETLRADVRLIAATNKNLSAAVAAGSFREDLFYRLNVFTITLPALRERRTDVPALAQYFLDKYSREHRRDIRRITSTALELLSAHAWPGNVRELENAIERAVVSCGGSVIDEFHLPEGLRGTASAEEPVRLTLSAAVERLERQMIGDAMREADGNLARASRALGTTERILRYKADKYGLISDRRARGPRSPRT
jgi:Nif-specific regulatory protein